MSPPEVPITRERLAREIKTLASASRANPTLLASKVVLHWLTAQLTPTASDEQMGNCIQAMMLDAVESVTVPEFGIYGCPDATDEGLREALRLLVNFGRPRALGSVYETKPRRPAMMRALGTYLGPDHFRHVVMPELVELYAHEILRKNYLKAMAAYAAVVRGDDDDEPSAA